MAGENTDWAVTGTEDGVHGSQDTTPMQAAPVDPNNPAGNNTGVSVPPNEPINASEQPRPILHKLRPHRLMSRCNLAARNKHHLRVCLPYLLYLRA